MKLMPLIQRPCSQDWNAMGGDDKRRFCEHCQLHVHNLTAMSPAEQRVLFSGPAGRRCVTYVTEGNVIKVQSGAWIFLQRLQPVLRVTAAIFAAMVPLFVSGCATTATPVDASIAGHTETQACKKPTAPLAAGDYKETLPPVGEIYYEPPLWRRIFVFWDP